MFDAGCELQRQMLEPLKNIRLSDFQRSLLSLVRQPGEVPDARRVLKEVPYRY